MQMHWPFSVCKKTVNQKRPRGLSYPRQLCLEMGFVLTDSICADKTIPDFIFPIFLQGVHFCVNSYVTRYLPIIFDNKT